MCFVGVLTVNSHDIMIEISVISGGFYIRNAEGEFFHFNHATHGVSYSPVSD